MMPSYLAKTDSSTGGAYAHPRHHHSAIQGLLPHTYSSHGLFRDSRNASEETESEKATSIADCLFDGGTGGACL